MDERDANIDIVFRNGFRNLEALPPAEVWDNIRPVIGRGQRRAFIIRRIAATAALIIAISALMYTWNDGETSLSLNNPSFNQESTSTDGMTSGKNRTVVTSDDQPTLIAAINPAEIRSPENNSDILKRIEFTPSEASLGITENEQPSPPSGDRISLSASSFFVEDPGINAIPETKTVKTADRWSLAALASPTYFSRLNFGKDNFSQQMISSEQPIISYSGGLALTYKINKRVSVQSGLFYSAIGQQINGISSFGGFRKYDNTKGSRNFEVMTSSGVVYTNNADVFLLDEASSRIVTQFTGEVFDPQKASLEYLDNSLRQNYSYLELPVFLRYKLIDKTLDINLIGGLSYNFLVDNSVYTMNQGSRYMIGKTEGLNMMTFSSSLGMGMEYSFTRNISLNLEPTFRYYMNPFKNVQESVIHPYSFGIFSGISFRF
jgi:hypothetical protein